MRPYVYIMGELNFMNPIKSQWHFLFCWILVMPFINQGWAQSPCSSGDISWADGGVVELCPNAELIVQVDDLVDGLADGYDWVWTPPGGEADTVATGGEIAFDGTQWNAESWPITFISDDDTCTLNLEISLLPLPNATFNVVADGFCADLPIDFDLVVDPEIEYFWSFGDGTTSTEPQPSHVYGTLGSGTDNNLVTLVMTQPEGCSDTTSQTVSVLEIPDIGIDEFGAICASQSAFPVYSEVVSSGDVSEWVVDWGNGEIGNYSAPGGIFSTSYDDGEFGYFPVVVTATGFNGCTSTLVDDVFVGNNPQVGSDNPGNTNGLCGPYELTFPINNINNNPPGTEYVIEFGDGNSIDFIHDLPNSPPPEVSHIYMNSSCGSVTPEGSQNAFRMRLEATNECGTSVITVDPIRIHETPNPAVNGPTDVCSGQNFNYGVDGIGEMVTESSCETPGVFWSATPLSGQSPPNPSVGFDPNFTTNFPEPGLYAIEVTPFHDYCDNPPDTLQVCAYPELTAVADALPLSGCAPLVVNLENFSPMPPICGQPEIEWIITGGEHDFILGDEQSDIAQVQLNEAGQYNITMELRIPNKGACPADQVTFTVEVSDEPTVIIAGPEDLCEGTGGLAEIAFFDDGNATIDGWQWQANGNLISTVQGEVNLQFDNPGEVILTGTATNLCGSDSHDWVLDVLPAPEVEFLLSEAPPYCAGEEIPLQVTGASSYLWTNNPPIIEGNLTDPNLVLISESDINLALTATGSNGCELDTNFSVTVAPLPELAWIAPSDLCPGDAMNPMVSTTGGSGTGYIYNWVVNGEPLSENADEVFIPAPSLSEDFTASVTVTDDVGCSATDSILWVSLDAPIVEAGLDTSFCLNPGFANVLTGYSPGLTEAGGIGEWGGTGVSAEGTFSSDVVGTFELIYSYTDIQGCQAEDVLSVEVVDLTPLDPGVPPVACLDDEAFVISGFSPATASWSGPPGVGADGMIDPATIGAGDFTLMLTQGTGSCYQEISSPLTIHPLPQPSISGPSTLCEGEPFTLLGAEPDGADLFWAGTSATSNEYAGTTIAGMQSFEVVAVSAAGCEATASWELMGNALPSLALETFPQICDQAIPVPLTGQATPAGGTWSGPGVDAGGDVFTPGEAGLVDLVYSYEDPSTGCENQITATIDVITTPQADAGPDLSICDIDTTMVLIGGPDPGGTWQGDFLTGNTLAANGLLPGTHTYTYTNGSGSCETTDAMLLEVWAKPEVDLVVTDATPCAGDTVWVEAEVTNMTPGPHDFQWWSPAVPAGDTDALSNAFVVVGDDALQPVSVEVTDGNGCQRLETYTLDIQALPTVEAGEDLLLCNQPALVPLDEASPAGGTWDGPVGLIGDAFDPAVSGLGAFMLTYSFVDAEGCVNVDSLVVEVEEPQQAAAGSNLSFCDVDSVGMVSGFSPATGGTWLGMGIDEDGGFDIDALTPGAYEWTYAYGTGTCFTEDAITVTIHENPQAVVQSDAPGGICDQGIVFFGCGMNGGAPPYTYDWPDFVMGLGDSAVTVVADFDPDNPILEVEVTVTDALGCMTTATGAVDVWPLPVVEAGANLTLCNQPIEAPLTGFSPLGGTWSGPIELTADGIFTPEGIGLFTAIYTYMDDNGCINQDVLEVDVVDPQIAEAGEDLAFCDVDAMGALTGFSPLASSWTGPGITDETGSYEIAALTPGEYTWLMEFGQGTCYTQDSVTVTIWENPEVELVHDAAVCDGEVTELEATPSGGQSPYDFVWAGDVEASGAMASITGDVSDGAVVPVVIEVVDVNGCLGTDSIAIDELALPIVDAGPDTTLCATGIEATLSAVTNVLGAGEWYGGMMLTADGTITPVSTANFDAIYTFTETETGYGCMNSDTVQVVIIDALQVDAGPDTTACFNSPPVTFEQVSPGSGVSWSAIEAGTNVGPDGTVAPSALGPGNYAFEALYGVATCLTRDTISIEVLPLPEIALPAPESFCGNLGVQVLGEALPTGGAWFGAGIVDADAGQFNTEVAATDYAPGYEYTDPLTGCTDTSFHAVTIHPVPTAAFDAPALGCTNAPVDLVQLSMGQSGQIWSFPPYATSDLATPAFTYPAAGDYTMELWVNNGFGCADSTTADITITTPPEANFDISTDFGCTPLEVSITDLSVAPHADTTWILNGIVQSTSDLPALTLEATGAVATYFLTLEISNLCGNSTDEATFDVYPEPEATFVIPEDTVCSPYDLVVLDTSPGLPDTWSWDFDNGETSNAEAPVGVTYVVDSTAATFDITLEVTNGCGASDTTISVVVLPNAVTAFFTTNTNSGCAPFTLEVTDFSDETTYVSYDFDNGDYSDQTPTATTTYTNPGVYIVQQFVSDGCSADTTTQAITVSESPQINLSAPAPDCATEAFLFDADVSTAVGAATWSFGDGTNGSGLQVSHVFPAGGSYWVTFQTASSLTGCAAEDSIQVTVHPVPAAEWTASEWEGCSPFSVAFNNASTGAGLSYTWDFGDGSDGETDANPSHTYTNNTSAPIPQSVTLMANNAFGCSDVATGLINVLPSPIASFALGQDESCTFPIELSVTNMSSGSVDHEWNWSGGDIIDAFEPSGLVANNVGSYTLILTATNGYGCAATASQAFTVHEAPVADFTVQPTFGCNPLSLAFSNNSFNAATTVLNIPGVYQGPIPTDLFLLNEVGNYTANLTVTSPEGCTDDMTLSGGIQVFPVPEANFEVTAQSTEPENTLFAFESTSSTDFLLNWDFGDGTMGSGTSVHHEYGGSGLFDVLLTAINNFGCSATHMETVEVGATLMIFTPSAFTPGGQGDFGIARPDGINDGWRPEIRGLEHINGYWLQIFNRWGELVWETRNPMEFWDGGMLSASGDRHYVQDEVLVWQLRLETSGDVIWDGGESDTGSRTYTGTVTIVR